MADTCRFPDCGNPIQRRELCRQHVEQSLKNNGVLTRLPKSLSIPERFWDKVDFLTDSGCWLWTASTGINGYGQFGINHQPVRAHRWSYEWLVGPIAEDLILDHICRVRNCVNPAHLRQVTNKQNAENRPASANNSSCGIRGVTWFKAAKRWMVQVKHNGQRHHGGYFKDLGDAERAAIALRNRLFTHNDTDRQEGVA
jgi:hypothetical protein